MPPTSPDSLQQLLDTLDPAARDKLLRELLAARAQPVPGTDPPAGFNWKYLVGFVGGLPLVGGTAAYFDPKTFENIHFRFTLANTPELLGVAAGIGAVVGFVYSIYHNNWSLALPQLSLDKVKGTVSLPRWGFLDEVLLAVVLAVLATWAKSPSDPPHKFTESTFALVAGAALAGARMRSGYADRDVLRDALAETVGQVAAPRRKIAVENAATSIDAVRATLGDNTATLPAKLRDLFDPAALADRLTAQGKPIGGDGNGLTLETLAQHQVLQSVLKPFVKDMRLPEVAAMSEADFLKAVANNGIDVTEFRPALVAIQKAAGDVMNALKALPPDWKMG